MTLMFWLGGFGLWCALSVVVALVLGRLTQLRDSHQMQTVHVPEVVDSRSTPWLAMPGPDAA